MKENNSMKEICLELPSKQRGGSSSLPRRFQSIPYP